MNDQLNRILEKVKEKAELDKYDDGYGMKLEDMLLEMVGVIPDEYSQRYLDVIEASVDSESSNVGTLILAENIPKQMGFVKYDEGGLCEPKKVQKEWRDYYLDVALKAASENPRFDDDILKNLPDIIRMQGPKTYRIIKTALKIRDEDFPGRNNVVLLYTGKKAGYHFCGNQEDQELEMNEVEHKFFGVPLRKKRVFDRKLVVDFCENVANMKDPRQRRAFMESFYSELVSFKLNDRLERKLEELDRQSLELVAELYERFGFENHAEKLLGSMHYKRIRKYDDTIEKFELPKDKQVSAVYVTRNTRKLDALFGLTGEPVDEDKKHDIVSPSYWIGRTEQEIVMPKFALVAAKTGHFIGLPFAEAAKVFGVSEGYLNDCVSEGYLEKFEHEGVTVVSPTDKYEPSGLSFMRRKAEKIKQEQEMSQK